MHKLAQLISTVNLKFGLVALTVLALVITGGLGYWGWRTQSQLQDRQQQLAETQNQLTQTQDELQQQQAAYQELSSQDQVKRNNDLETELSNIRRVYLLAVSVYESLLDLKITFPQSQPLDAQFTKALTLLANRNYASASA